MKKGRKKIMRNMAIAMKAMNITTISRVPVIGTLVLATMTPIMIGDTIIW
jgi:hypothetical protein